MLLLDCISISRRVPKTEKKNPLPSCFCIFFLDFVFSYSTCFALKLALGFASNLAHNLYIEVSASNLPWS